MSEYVSQLYESVTVEEEHAPECVRVVRDECALMRMSVYMWGVNECMHVNECVCVYTCVYKCVYVYMWGCAWVGVHGCGGGAVCMWGAACVGLCVWVWGVCMWGCVGGGVHVGVYMGMCV